MMKIFIYGDENRLSNYKNALLAVGGIPIITQNIEAATDCDGLLLAGGGDISPCFYGSVQKNCRSVNLVRDITEQYLLALFEKRNAPVMGVCRGLQLLNVYYGGTLAQSIADKRLHYDDDCDVFHRITNKSGFLKEIFGNTITVNSCHRQKIELSGKNVVVCSYSTDGVPEGAYIRNRKIFGVQFHPERPFLNGSKDGLKLYEYFLSLL